MQFVISIQPKFVLRGSVELYMFLLMYVGYVNMYLCDFNPSWVVRVQNQSSSTSISWVDSRLILYYTNVNGLATIPDIR